MHKPWLTGWMSLFVVALIGCGADAKKAPDGDGTHELPERDGGIDDPRDEDAAVPDGERAAEVGEACQQAAGLAAAGELASVFTAQGEPTLDLAADGCANMESVSARVVAATGGEDSGCVALTPSCSEGAGTLEAVFTSCTLSDTGSTLSGTVTVGLPTGGTDVELLLELESVTLVSGGVSYTVSGTLNIYTFDLVRYDLLAALDYEDYELVFQGQIAAQESETGALQGVTFDGEGTLSGATSSTELGSWMCEGSDLMYQLDGFHRALAECRADAGTLRLTRAYACTKEVGNKTVEGEATITDVVAFSEDTPETSSVHVTTIVTVGEQETETETELDVTLPGECP